MSDTPRTDDCEGSASDHPDCMALTEQARQLERELAAAIAQADAMDEFLGSATKREKEASAIIAALTADINITVPIRDYSAMSPLECYELGLMDGVAALKTQINAAIDAAMKEGWK